MGRRHTESVSDAALPTPDDDVLWPTRLAKIRVQRASKGTGWAIGATGVLTARQVIEPLLAPADGATPAETPGDTAEVVIGASPGRSFEARVIWESTAAGLAILQVTERSRATWQALLGKTPEELLAYPRPEPITRLTLTGLPAKAAPGSESSTIAWMLQPPEHAVGVLLPGDDRSARAILELPRKTLPRAARRHAMLGGVVHTNDPAPMVLGIVTARPRGRSALRFETAVLPDTDHDPALRAALKTVGAHPAIVTMDGPLNVAYLRADCLDPALRPKRAADIADPGWFGTKLARVDIAGTDDYFGWVSRPERHSLAVAIDRALDGNTPRFIVLRGPSAAGKSRLAAETIHGHARLHDYALVAPHHGQALADIPAGLLPPRTVIYVDDLHDYPATAFAHERTRVFLADNPEILVIATTLELPEAGGGARLVESGTARRTDDEWGAGFPLASASLSGVHSVLDDDVLTVTVTVPAETTWARAGGSSNRSDWALARARKQGLGLGEYLAGYHELTDHYTAALWPTRALVDLVGDWARCGVGGPLPMETARALWERLVPTQLPRDELRAFSRLTPIEKERRWRGALAYACDAVLGCAALVFETSAGLVASEFVRVHIDQGATSAVLWDYLLTEHPTSPLQRVDIGIAALSSGTAQRALRAFESVLFYRDSDEAVPPVLEVIARRGIAIYHARTGRDEQAVMVYTDLVDTFGSSQDPDVCEQVAQALLGIGLTFGKLGSNGQAVSAYTELVQRYQDHPSPTMSAFVAKALLGQATTLAVMDRHAEERAAYADIVERYSDEPGMAVQAIVAIARTALAGSPSTSD